MKITAIRTTPFTVPLRRTIGFAHGTLAETQHVLIEIETDEGITGFGEAPSRPFFYGESQRSIIAAIEDWFAPALLGTDPFATGNLWPMFDRTEHNNTAKGAIDIALHDIIGKALGVSCARLMGNATDGVRVTYVCGYSSPEEMAEEAVAVNEKHGIDSFKIKVGVAHERDAETLARMREALPDALMYVDANEGFDRHGTLRLLDMCAQHDIAWAEEPCQRKDRAGREIAGRAGAVPILGDESCRTLDEVALEINSGSVSLVSIKVARTGFGRSRDIIGLCLANNVRPMIGSQGDSGIGVIAGAHFCAAHHATSQEPAELSFHLNLADDLLSEPPIIEAGRLKVPERPGLGVDIDKDRLAHLRVQ